MSKLTSVIIIFIILLTSTGTSGTEPKLLLDFIEKQTNPVQITGILCWSQKKLFEFWKGLSKTHLSTIGNFQEGTSSNSGQLAQYQLILLNLSCEHSHEILNNARTNKQFQAPFRWVLFGVPSFNLTEYYFGLDSKVYLVQNSQVVALYKPGITSGGFQRNFVGTWGKTRGFQEFNSLVPARNRSNMMKENLTVSFVITDNDTHEHFWDYRNIHVDAVTKVNYILAHHLTTILNGSLRLLFHGTWGFRNPNTSQYHGMFGDLHKGLADIGGTPAFLTEDRIDTFDFVTVTLQTSMKFILRAPPFSYVQNVFVLTFDRHVWYAFYVIIPIILVTLYVITLWEWSDPIFREKVSKKNKTLRPKVFDVFMLEFGAISQQGTDEEPHSNAGRIATIFTFITLMFLYTAYSANIVALLQTTTDTIKTVQDLLNSRIKLGVEDISYQHYYFENEREPIRKQIFDQKINPKGQKSNFMPTEEGMLKVRDEFFAFHVELDKAYKAISKMFQESEKCGLKEIDYVNFYYPMLSAHKNSPYKEIFKIGYRKLQESGIQNGEFRRFYTRKPTCLNKGSNFVSVGLIDCYSAFVFFGAGVFCSVTLMVIEVFLNRHQKR